MDSTNTNTEQIKLDLSLLNDGELSLLKSQTGIEDMEALTKHVEDVTSRAHKVFGYQYLTSMTFLKSKFAALPVIYKHVLEVGKSRQDALFLDIGCGLGHDTRKLVWDGYPAQNVIASDLFPEFWTLGHELFKSTPESFPVLFIPGDAFDDNFIPVDSKPSTTKPSTASLASSKSLAPLQGHVSFIHASALFHLFQEEKQVQLAKKLASLLSPAPGSVIFGLHRGLPEAGEVVNGRGETIYLHSAETWKKLWVGEEGSVFSKGEVEVEVNTLEIPFRGKFHALLWSVKRL